VAFGIMLVAVMGMSSLFGRRITMVLSVAVTAGIAVVFMAEKMPQYFS